MYDSRTNLAQQVAQEVREHFPDQMLDTIIPRSVRVSEAPSYGQSVISYDYASSGSLSYREAAAEIARRGAATQKDTTDGNQANRSRPRHRRTHPDRRRRHSRQRPVDVFFPDADSTPATAIAAVEQAAAAEGLLTVPGARLARLDPDDIVPNAQQPRSNFDPEDLAELVHSIREFGVLQPIVVRPHPDQIGKYELVMGERRLRATKAAGLDTIPAVVKDTAERGHAPRCAAREPAPVAAQPAGRGVGLPAAARRLRHHAGGARHAHRPIRPQITNTLRLLKLPEAVQLRVAAGVLSAGHARAILSLGDDPEEMQRFADKIVNEELSVRAAEAIATSEPKRVACRSRPRASARTSSTRSPSRLGDRLNTRVRSRWAPEKARSASISRPCRTCAASSRSRRGARRRLIGSAPRIAPDELSRRVQRRRITDSAAS